MNPHLPAMETALEGLATAIRTFDAPAIHTASEALAVAVSGIDGAFVDRLGRPDLDKLADFIARLQTLSMEVNLHSQWTRQRIDSLADLRGQRHLKSGLYC
ncbi:MAG: hypothetical protein SFV20_00865 [Sphingopyxis sp.]|nr:hypothetical protein [Sphingopyxis sp.]